MAESDKLLPTSGTPKQRILRSHDHSRVGTNEYCTTGVLKSNAEMILQRCQWGPGTAYKLVMIYHHQRPSSRLLYSMAAILKSMQHDHQHQKVFLIFNNLYFSRDRSTTENFCSDEIRPRDWLNVSRPLSLGGKNKIFWPTRWRKRLNRISLRPF